MTEPVAPPQAARCAACGAARLLRDRHDLPDCVDHLRRRLEQLEHAVADFRQELEDLHHELRRRR